jgi:photosystem II stability/assembly factor-like uncharacterized protein
MNKRITTYLTIVAAFTFSVLLWNSNGNSYSPRDVSNQSPTGIIGYAEYIRSIKANEITGDVSQDDVKKVISQINRQSRAKSKTSWPLKWSFMGPDNVGGRTRDLLVDRNNSDVLYAGGVSGMLFKSENRGASWRPVTQDASNFGVTSLGQTSNGDIFYGTGEGGFVTAFGAEEGTPGFQGFGVFVSRDNGESFSRLDNTLPFGYINDIKTNAEGNILFVGAQRGLYATTDGGENWSQVRVGQCRDFAISKNNVILASFGSAFFRSTDPMDGDSYELVSGFVGSRIVPGWSESDPNICYFMTIGQISENIVPRGLNGAGFTGLYKSTDAGETFEEVAPAATTFFHPMANFRVNTQGNFDACIGVHPRNPNRVFIGGVHFAEWTPEKGPVIVGNRFNAPTNPFGIHADKHRIVFDNSGDIPVMYVTSDGGISMTTNAGLDRYTDRVIGYNTTQFYGIAAGPNNIVMGGTQDNSNIILEKNTSGRYQGRIVIGGDGFQTAVSKRNPRIFFGESQYGNLRRSLNNGSNFERMWDNRIAMSFATGASATAYRDDATGVQPNNLFNTPLHLWEGSPELLDSIQTFGDDEAYDDRFEARLFIGMDDGVWMTPNPYGTRYSTPQPNVNVPPRTVRWFRVFGFTGTGGNRLHYLTTSRDGNHLFVATTRGEIHRISNLNHGDFNADSLARLARPDTVVNFEIRGNLNLGNRTVTGIAVDPTDANHVVITVGNYGNTNYVYRTRNALDTTPQWSSIQSNLPQFPVYHAVINEKNPNEIILGTEFGIWATQNGLSNSPNWTESVDGANELVPFPRVPVFDVVQISEKPWTGPRIYAGTHGMGVWETASTLTSVPKQPKDNLRFKLNVYPNPTMNYFQIKTDLKGSLDITIYNLAGQKIYETTNINIDNKIDASSWNKGVYLVQVSNGQQKAVSRLVVN